jgi:predicted transcriptional regulator
MSATREAPMSWGSVKQKVLEAIERLPADATLEDAIERLVLLAKIERGLDELDAGRGIDHTEAKRRLLP